MGSEDEVDDYGWSERTGRIYRAIVEFSGDNADGLIDAAARHFTSPAIVRRTEPLTDEELRMLAEDDEQIFGNQ